MKLGLYTLYNTKERLASDNFCGCFRNANIACRTFSESFNATNQRLEQAKRPTLDKTEYRVVYLGNIDDEHCFVDGNEIENVKVFDLDGNLIGNSDFIHSLFVDEFVSSMCDMNP